MRILHLADRLSDRGGAYTWMLGILDGLVEGGHEVRLAMGAVDGDVPAPCAIDEVPSLASRVASPVDLDPVVRAFAPDVVHVHNVTNPVVLEWAAARPEALLTIQDHRCFCPARGKWTLAGEMCRELMARETCAPCVLFVGRLVAAKGVREVVEAWRRSGVDLPLVVAGTGPLRGEVLAQARAGTVPPLEAPGWVDRRRLSVLYRRARALLLPSRWQEPFGITGIEAFSFGVPVVAWESGGVGEWHPGLGLVPWGDVDALARALAEAVGRRNVLPPRFPREETLGRLLTLYGRIRSRT
jgi:glycosyltransferase involved in cell wall biosynthesis